MCELLGRDCLSGLSFYELGIAMGIISQTLSHCANIVTLGCDAERNALLLCNSAHDKHLEDEGWENKLFPVCWKGDFEKAASFSGAVCVHA